jgi:uncharacterized protein (TIGR02996 family)
MAKKRHGFSSREESLLHAIHDDPRSDDIRRIYADWLDDHGHSDYAEFIRLQLQHGAWETWSNRRSPRERDLAMTFGRTWAREQSFGLRTFGYFRGLPMPSTSLRRCRTPRLDRMAKGMNPRYRFSLSIEQGELFHPREGEAIMRHPFMRRVAVIHLFPDPREGNLEGFLNRLAALSLPATAERFVLRGAEGRPLLLAQRLCADHRYVLET